MNTIGKLHPVAPQDLLWTPIMSWDQRFFPKPWSRESWESLNLEHHGLWAWMVKEEPTGFALFFYVPGSDVAHLLKIFVDPSKRGTHEARNFWTSLVSELKTRGASSIYLEVEANNLRARAFYAKVGFEVIRQVKAYYSDGSDAVMMSVAL